MAAYYNEFDPFAAAWLRELIKDGLIADGEVDERSIKEVTAADLADFTQCHFFAGIGGWSFALRLAGWDDTRPVWTGSCPCQPFSAVGQRRGVEDERHLWPVWHPLIRQCRPPVVFGEQVDKAAVWLDCVFSDMEASGYACAAADLPAASVGARHIRQRIWFVAHSDQAGWSDAERVAAAKAEADKRIAARLVNRPEIEAVRWAPGPDPSWIVDGLSGQGFAVGAYGNAICPQAAAHFIQAADEAMTSLQPL